MYCIFENYIYFIFFIYCDLLICCALHLSLLLVNKLLQYKTQKEENNISEIALKLISDLSLTPKVHFQLIKQPHQLINKKLQKQGKHLFIQISNCSMTLYATYKTTFLYFKYQILMSVEKKIGLVTFKQGITYLWY